MNFMFLDCLDPLRCGFQGGLGSEPNHDLATFQIQCSSDRDARSFSCRSCVRPVVECHEVLGIPCGSS